MPLSFWNDLKNRELLPVKVLLFLQSAGDMALYPFLTLHMKYLGISLTEIGIQFALTPIATLISSPLVGLLADKIGNFKIMLSISLLICAAISQCLLFVPPVHKIPEPHAPIVARIDCHATNVDNIKIDNPGGREKDLLMDTFNRTSNSSQILLFLQCQSTCALLCSEDDVKTDCQTSSNFEIVTIHDQWTLDDPFLLRTMRFIEGPRDYDSLKCLSSLNRTCSIDCQRLIRNDTVDTFKPKLVPDPHSKQTTFWLYLAIRLALIVTIATEMSLLKAAILTLVDKCDSEYGYQRVWATVATCIVPLIAGVMMDKLRSGEVEDYRPCFYIYGGMKVLMAILTVFVDLSAKAPTLELFKNLRKLLQNPEAAVLLCYVTFIGSCWGFLETFLLWYLESLGASRLLMGLTFTVGSLSGIPTSIFAGAIERRIGHVYIIVIGLVAYAVRFVGYSYIATAYQALIFEVLECLTMSLMLVTITTYANVLATSELVATMQATWAALHFAVGRALGSVVGGYMMEGLGSRLTYQMYAVKCVVLGLLYALIYQFWLKRRPAADAFKVKPQDVEKNDVTGDCKPSELKCDDVKLKMEQPTNGSCNGAFVPENKVDETLLHHHPTTNNNSLPLHLNSDENAHKKSE